MLDLNSLFDDYGLRARLLPALVVVLPAAAIVALLFADVYATYTRIFGSLGIVAVALYLLAHVIRARGRSLEQRLYVKWGGTPTTAWLRHRDARLDPLTKARYHRFLGAQVPGLAMPSVEAEQSNPHAADYAYASAVKWLLEHTRDTKAFKLVFDENVSYGFRRNTLAAKPMALTLLLIFIFIAAGVTYSRFESVFHFDVDTLAAWIVALVSCGTWLLLVTEAWVKDGSDAYARALLAACEKG